MWQRGPPMTLVVGLRSCRVRIGSVDRRNKTMRTSRVPTTVFAILVVWAAVIATGCCDQHASNAELEAANARAKAAEAEVARLKVEAEKSKTQQTNSVSPFQGHWVGTFANSRLSQNGTMDFTIETDGVLSTSFHNNTLNESTNATGTIDRHGKLTYTYVYNGIKHDGIGTLVLDANSGHLKGTINIYVNSQDVGADEVDLSKQ
jgi:hypothetical protein